MNKHNVVIKDIREQIEWLTKAEDACMEDERPLAAESYSRIRKTMENLLAVYELVSEQSHLCSNNRCIGLFPEEGYHCHTCATMLAALTAVKAIET